MMPNKKTTGSMGNLGIDPETETETKEQLYPFISSVSCIFLQGKEYTRDKGGIVWLPYTNIKGMTPAKIAPSTQGERQ